MVVDTSAIVAILQGEPERERFERLLAAADARHLSAANRLECTAVLEGRHGEEGRAALEDFLIEAAVEIVPVSARQAELACEAWRRYGKGRHPAGLNFGDCFAYALASDLNEPLLFKGDDFARTDIASAA